MFLNSDLGGGGGVGFPGSPRSYQLDLRIWFVLSYLFLDV